jgi:hypothetical protein
MMTYPLGFISCDKDNTARSARWQEHANRIQERAMTKQIPNYFEYEGKEYCILGYTGGRLPSASDFGMRFSAGSTANWRGHIMHYGISNEEMLVVKRIKFDDEEILPITHDYKVTKTGHGSFYDNLNQIIPMTGHYYSPTSLHSSVIFIWIKVLQTWRESTNFLKRVLIKGAYLARTRSERRFARKL